MGYQSNQRALATPQNTEFATMQTPYAMTQTPLATLQTRRLSFSKLGFAQKVRGSSGDTFVWLL